MSRDYKDAEVAAAIQLGASISNGEILSGADLEQVRLAAKAGSAPDASAFGAKTLNANTAFAGNPDNAELSGADVEWSAGQ